MYKAIIIRFLKAALAGGIAQALLIINAGLTIHNLADFKAVGTVLLAAFLTGALMAIEKALNWTPPA